MNYENATKKMKGFATGHNVAFTKKLVPNAGEVLGVTVPEMRALAKEVASTDFREYCDTCEFKYYEDLFLYGLALCHSKESFAAKIPYLKIFVSKLTNWAACDSVTMTLKIKKAELPLAFDLALEYLNSDKEFDLRFAIVLLMRNFLNDEYVDQTIDLLDNVHSDYYYVKMALAWTLCDIIIKYPDKALKYLERANLNQDVINKAVQKARDSFRVPNETKEYLLKFRKSQKIVDKQ